LEPVEVAENNTDRIEAATVSESSLKKGFYYIQIAAYEKRENLEAVLDKYGKYPIVFVKNSSGISKVLVGPLSVDEYGAVLAKFRSFGFKDAFVKTIK
ncbi:MAG: SPOR domain-containing protein, partial [Spirochaetia bacterium]|nr:SPOR domain-containing protein [Spirochaetia bacterium]